MKHVMRISAITEWERQKILCEICGLSGVDYIQYNYMTGEKTRGFHDSCLEKMLPKTVIE